MDLAVNSVSALPFYGLVMCRDIEQNLMYSLLFLYPVLNNCTCFVFFCGGGAVIWSRLFSNVKYEYVGLRYLANPRKNQHWENPSCHCLFSPRWSPRGVLLEPSVCLGIASAPSPSRSCHLPVLLSVPSRSCSLGK